MGLEEYFIYWWILCFFFSNCNESSLVMLMVLIFVVLWLYVVIIYSFFGVVNVFCDFLFDGKEGILILDEFLSFVKNNLGVGVYVNV